MWSLQSPLDIISVSMPRAESLYLAGASMACLKNLCPKSGAVFRADSAPGESSPALLGALA